MAKLVARDSHLIDDGYLFLFLNSKQATIKSSCRGTTVPHVSPEALKSLKLPLPPLIEQERIVNLVSSVDSYIAALQQQADAARAARNAVLSELLSTGGEDWSESSVHDVLAVSIGGVWGSNPGVDEIDVYVYRQTEFGNDGRLIMPSDAVRSITHKQFKSRVLQPGDVLMQKSAGTPTLPGRVVIVPPGIESNATCSNFLHLLKSDTDRCTPQFLFWFLWLSHKSGRAFEFQRGTNIRNLDLNEYLDQSMMLPPLAEQKRIVDIASSMDQALQSTERAVLVAKRLRSGLLSDLLSGRHEIPESYDRLMGAA
jgi:type I restriction enzyme S subunit